MDSMLKIGLPVGGPNNKDSNSLIMAKTLFLTIVLKGSQTEEILPKPTILRVHKTKIRTLTVKISHEDSKVEANNNKVMGMVIQELGLQ